MKASASFAVRAERARGLARRHRALAALGTALAGALACLPESSDLSSHSRNWQRDGAGSSGQAGMPAGGAAGVAGGAAGSGALPSLGGSSSAGAGMVVSAPIVLPSEPPGDAGDSSDPSEADAGSTGGGSAGEELCADGVLDPSGATCYQAATVPAAWDAARAACSAWGGALVKVESAEEDRFVGELVPASIWLGASDLGVDNVYAWTDGTPVVYGNWGPSQPDAFPGPDCIEKRFEAGQVWFDQPCANERLYVCEKGAS